MFVLHLDHRSTGVLNNSDDWTRAGNLTLHGEGTTRWCDKSFNLCVYANGDAAVHADPLVVLPARTAAQITAEALQAQSHSSTGARAGHSTRQPRAPC